MEHGEIYTRVVAVVVSGVMLAAAVMTRHNQLRSITLLAAVNMSIALLLTGPGALTASPLAEGSSLYPLMIAGALPLAAIAIKQTIVFNLKKA